MLKGVASTTSYSMRSRKAAHGHHWWAAADFLAFALIGQCTYALLHRAE